MKKQSRLEDFAEFLVEAGIDSMSLNPDSLVAVKRRVARLEQERAEARQTDKGRRSQGRRLSTRTSMAASGRG